MLQSAALCPTQGRLKPTSVMQKILGKDFWVILGVKRTENPVRAVLLQVCCKLHFQKIYLVE